MFENNSNMKSCCICKRELNKKDDPLSGDCGGDCWGCIGPMEADSGCKQSLKFVRKEFQDGLRQDWMPKPITKFKFNKTIDGLRGIDIRIKLIRPLGEPWSNESFKLLICVGDLSSENNIVLDTSTLVTNSRGIIRYKYQFNSNLNEGELFFKINRKTNTWVSYIC